MTQDEVIEEFYDIVYQQVDRDGDIDEGRCLLAKQELKDTLEAYVAVLQRRVEWTRERPDKQGWYWWRTPQITLAVYIEFGEQGNGLVSFAYGERYRSLKDMNGEWQGPITPHEAHG